MWLLDTEQDRRSCNLWICTHSASCRTFDCTIKGMPRWLETRVGEADTKVMAVPFPTTVGDQTDHLHQARAVTTTQEASQRLTFRFVAPGDRYRRAKNDAMRSAGQHAPTEAILAAAPRSAVGNRKKKKLMSGCSEDEASARYVAEVLWKRVRIASRAAEQDTPAEQGMKHTSSPLAPLLSNVTFACALHHRRAM